MKTLRAIVCAALLSMSLSARSDIRPVSVEVVDAANNVLGTTHTYFGGSVIMLEVDSHLIQANVFATHLASINPVYFATSDCSGQAFAAWFPGNIFEPSAVVTLSNSVYAGPRAPRQTVSTLSRLDQGVNGCQVASVVRNDLVPVQFIRDLTPYFQPPFHARAAAANFASAPALSTEALAFLALALAVPAVYFLRSGGS